MMEIRESVDVKNDCGIRELREILVFFFFRARFFGRYVARVDVIVCFLSFLATVLLSRDVGSTIRDVYVVVLSLSS